MEHYQIVNIHEILNSKNGSGYGGEVAVFVSEDTSRFYISNGSPVYVNAFSYALVLSGSASLSVDAGSYRVSRHSLCILSPLHLTHFSCFTDDFRCMFLTIHKDFIDRMGLLNLKQRIATGMNIYSTPVIRLSAGDASQLDESIRMVARQIGRSDHLYQLEMIRNSIVCFYLELDNILGRMSLNSGQCGGTLSRGRVILQDFVSLLMDNYRSEHSVAFYAGKMSITPHYLTRVVKALTGKTVNAFIFELIYSDARNMLISTDRSVQQISGLLNFSDQASFSKFFKRHSGMSPQEFRTLNALYTISR